MAFSKSAFAIKPEPRCKQAAPASPLPEATTEQRSCVAPADHPPEWWKRPLVGSADNSLFISALHRALVLRLRPPAPSRKSPLGHGPGCGPARRAACEPARRSFDHLTCHQPYPRRIASALHAHPSGARASGPRCYPPGLALPLKRGLSCIHHHGNCSSGFLVLMRVGLAIALFRAGTMSCPLVPPEEGRRMLKSRKMSGRRYLSFAIPSWLDWP
jgi:hypothetical protein